MKRIIVTAICFLIGLNIFPARSTADIFETEYGLRKTVVIIRNGDVASYAKAMEIARKMGARGLIGLPPTMIFGRFPSGAGGAGFGELDVRFVTDPADIDPVEIDIVTLKVARGLLDQEKILSMSRPIPMEPFDDMVLEIPRELVERTAPRAGSLKRGAPAEILDRGIRQNSEFLIGRVLVNIVLPESSGRNQSENWTEDEIGNVLRDISLGLSQYENATHWVKPPLEFQVNCPALHRGVPVSIEPSEGNWDYDPIWISEAITYLAENYDIDIPSGAWALEMTHYFNNALRKRDLNEDGSPDFDWAFTAFVADASVNKCWLPLPDGGTYAAYSYLGGPYLVCCYPACGFGEGINFAHVFIHEMSHTFWALDEYASAEASCKARGGYLNYINGNSYFEGCGAGHDCIMNNYLLTEPLPICQWTMGQVGLADEYDIFTGLKFPNSIPDIYEVRPILEAYITKSDTTFFGDMLISIRAQTIPVPNQNPAFEEMGIIPIDYAPEITSFRMSVNGEFFDDVPGKWTGMSSFNRGFILKEGLVPGENSIRFSAENSVGLSDTAAVRVYFVGIRYYAMSAMAEIESIEIRWQTAVEIFGADFDIYRQDLTDRSPRTLLASVKGASYSDLTDTRKHFRYMDDTVMPGHKYRYQVVGEIDVVMNNMPKTLVYESNEMIETAVVPLAGNFVSSIIPNPTDDRGSTFSIDVPRSYFDPSGTTSRDMLRAPAAETKTDVLVKIYDVAGRHVRHLYELGVFGGQIITISWDGLDDRGRQVAAGIYFMKVKAGPKEQVRKVVIIR